MPLDPNAEIVVGLPEGDLILIAVAAAIAGMACLNRYCRNVRRNQYQSNPMLVVDQSGPLWEGGS